MCKTMGSLLSTEERKKEGRKEKKKGGELSVDIVPSNV
jgi:hypothetical protein